MTGKVEDKAFVPRLNTKLYGPAALSQLATPPLTASATPIDSPTGTTFPTYHNGEVSSALSYIPLIRSDSIQDCFLGHCCCRHGLSSRWRE